MPFIEHSEEDVREMLDVIGAKSVKELFSDIPSDCCVEGVLDLPESMSEMDLVAYMRRLASKNRPASAMKNFMGAGAYDHYIPAVVDAMGARGEFFTAYTPYQAEASQGTLQTIFEFQTMIASVTGMEVANASMYDGASAMAEACVVAHFTKKKAARIVISGGLHPEYVETIKTYLDSLPIELVEVPLSGGRVDLDALKKELETPSTAVAYAQPNFLGCVEDQQAIIEIAHDAGAAAIAAVDPITLGVLASPGECGADIVVGDAQHFGNPVAFGGPHLGFFAASSKYVRKMPGRLVGQTLDKNGNRGWVLTLQTREQHIRREKATSNICSNQALCAFRAMNYMAAIGKEGFRETSSLCLQKAHYAAEKLTAIDGVKLAFDAPFFREFALELPLPADEVFSKLEKKGYAPGVPLARFTDEWKNLLLVAVTEQQSREDIDGLAREMGGAL